MSAIGIKTSLVKYFRIVVEETLKITEIAER